MQFTLYKPEATPTLIPTLLGEDAHPFIAVFSNDDRYIYISDSTNPVLLVVDVKTLKIIRRINVERPLHQLVMSKDGNTIFGLYNDPHYMKQINSGIVKISNIGSNNSTVQYFTDPHLAGPLGLVLHE